MGKNVRTIVTIGLATFLSGCIGIVTLHNPEIERDDLNFKLAGRGFISDYNEVNYRYTKSQLLGAWGAPNNVTRNGDIEYLQYKQRGLAWAGIVPVVIIPLPLVVPVGKNGVIFGFNNEQLISVKSQSRHGILALCGMFLMDEPSGFKFGCVSKGSQIGK